jgi:hypothetical protein
MTWKLNIGEWRRLRGLVTVLVQNRIGLTVFLHFNNEQTVMASPLLEPFAAVQMVPVGGCVRTPKTGTSPHSILPQIPRWLVPYMVELLC